MKTKNQSLSGTDPNSLIGQTITVNTGGSKYCCYLITNVDTNCDGSNIVGYSSPYTNCSECVTNNGCRL